MGRGSIWRSQNWRSSPANASIAAFPINNPRTRGRRLGQTPQPAPRQGRLALHNRDRSHQAQAPIPRALERSPSELNRGRDSRIGFDLLEDCRRAKEAAGMALSDDLRERVVGAVVEGGMSRNAAAKRFGVSIASAVRWVARFKAKGEISPAPTGGDR